MDPLSKSRYLMINMIAGADTTAITIRAVLYYVFRDKRVWAKLQEEVLKDSSKVPIALENARQMRYLVAVVREAIRMYPAVGMTSERYIPPRAFECPMDRLFHPAR
jgi:cytochrome P450